MSYVAIINTPGYLPEDDDPSEFDTAREAWECLADRLGIDLQDLAGRAPEEHMLAVAETLRELREAAQTNDTGVIYGPTPGYIGEHDLGKAFSVVWVE